MFEETLQDLRRHGALSLKAEFEAEGSTYEEVSALGDLARNSGLGLTVKIGGCEAIRDLRDAITLHADSIVAPMIESPYAAQKFVQAAFREVAHVATTALPELTLNIETVTGVSALHDILLMDDFTYIGRIVVGRSDLAGSLGLGPDGVEGSEVRAHARRVFELARHQRIHTTLGGGITVASLPFLGAFSGLIDTVETRKVVFDLSNTDDARLVSGIKLALRFELQWLQHKAVLNGALNYSDSTRLTTLTDRLGVA